MKNCTEGGNDCSCATLLQQKDAGMLSANTAQEARESGCYIVHFILRIQLVKAHTVVRHALAAGCSR